MELGRTHKIREVLELGPGSVVGLTAAGEPVDILVNGKTAKGELVVIDENLVCASPIF